MITVQCRLPDIDRQTPAGLPCSESDSLVADRGELHCHSLGQLPRPAQCRTAAFFLHPIHILCHMFFLFRPYFFHFGICDRREWICPPCNRRAQGNKGFRESGNITLLLLCSNNDRFPLHVNRSRHIAESKP